MYGQQTKKMLFSYSLSLLLSFSAPLSPAFFKFLSSLPLHLTCCVESRRQLSLGETYAWPNRLARAPIKCVSHLRRTQPPCQVGGFRGINNVLCRDALHTPLVSPERPGRKAFFPPNEVNWDTVLTLKPESRHISLQKPVWLWLGLALACQLHRAMLSINHHLPSVPV